MSQVTLPDVPVGSTGWGGTVNGYWAQIQAALRPPVCIVTRNANTNIPDVTATVLPWQSVVYDPSSMFNSGNNRIVVPTAGIYKCDVQTLWNNSFSSTLSQLTLRKLVSGSMVIHKAQADTLLGGLPYISQTISCLLECAAGDEFDVTQYQNSGVTQVQFGNNTLTWFSLARLAQL